MQEQLQTFQEGDIVGERYKVLRKLGAGGMGQVYEVQDLKLNSEKLALKIITPSDAEKGDPHAVERFRSEVLISRKLTHQNLIRTYDFGVLTDGRLYMTMELVDGTTLDDYIKKNKDQTRNFPFALFILRKVAEALHYAQRAGVTHRDLKTQNILISKSGDVKIADFGLAQMKGFDKKLTVVGECVGTPFYMSPEQVQGKSANHLSDIYALGIIAYELVTAKVPFDDNTWYNLAKKIVNEPLPDFVNEKNGIPPWYDAFVRKAAAKHPEDRFQSAGEIVKLFDENCFNQKNPEVKPEFEPITEQYGRNRLIAVDPNERSGGWFFTAILILMVFSLLGVGGYFGFKNYEKKEVSAPTIYNGPMKLAPSKIEDNSFKDISRKKTDSKDEDSPRFENIRKLLERQMIKK